MWYNLKVIVPLSLQFKQKVQEYFKKERSIADVIAKGPLYYNILLQLTGAFKYNKNNFTQFSPQVTTLLKLRRHLKKYMPGFKRYKSATFKRLDTSWRRPKGCQNKSRRKIQAKGAHVSIGYRSPALVRKRNAKGYPTVYVTNVADVTKLSLNKNKSQVMVEISRLVGLRKRMILENLLHQKGYYITNKKKVVEVVSS